MSVQTCTRAHSYSNGVRLPYTVVDSRDRLRKALDSSAIQARYWQDERDAHIGNFSRRFLDILHTKHAPTSARAYGYSTYGQPYRYATDYSYDLYGQPQVHNPLVRPFLTPLVHALFTDLQNRHKRLLHAASTCAPLRARVRWLSACVGVSTVVFDELRSIRRPDCAFHDCLLFGHIVVASKHGTYSSSATIV